MHELAWKLLRRRASRRQTENEKFLLPLCDVDVRERIHSYSFGKFFKRFGLYLRSRSLYDDRRETENIDESLTLETREGARTKLDDDSVKSTWGREMISSTDLHGFTI